MTNQKFIALAKRIVEVQDTVSTLNKELKSLKGELTEEMVNLGLKTFECGSFNAVLADKSRKSLSTELLKSVMGVTPTDECYNNTQYTELRVRRG